MSDIIVAVWLGLWSHIYIYMCAYIEREQLFNPLYIKFGSSGIWILRSEYNVKWENQELLLQQTH